LLHQPEHHEPPDDADPELETTPAGQIRELEEEIAEDGATFDEPED